MTCYADTGVAAVVSGSMYASRSALVAAVAPIGRGHCLERIASGSLNVFKEGGSCDALLLLLERRV